MKRNSGKIKEKTLETANLRVTTDVLLSRVVLQNALCAIMGTTNLAVA